MHSNSVIFKAADGDSSIVRQITVISDEDKTTIKFGASNHTKQVCHGFELNKIQDSLSQMQKKGDISEGFYLRICKNFPNVYAAELDITNAALLDKLTIRYDNYLDNLKNDYRYDCYPGMEFLSTMSKDEFRRWLFDSFSQEARAVKLAHSVIEDDGINPASESVTALHTLQYSENISSNITIPAPTANNNQMRVMFD